MPCSSSFTTQADRYLQSERGDLFDLYARFRDDHVTVHKRRMSSPIDWLATPYHPLRKKPYITEIHVQAANALQEDFFKAGYMPPLTQRWGEKVDEFGHKSVLYEKDMDKRGCIEARLQRSFVLAGDYFGLLIRICCFHESLHNCEQFYGLKRGTAKAILRDMLEKIASVYSR